MKTSAKSVRCAVAAAAAVVLALSSTAEAAAPVCGDVTDDGEVLAGDALAVLRKAVGQQVELICTDQCAVLEQRIAALEALLANVSKVGNNLVVTGVNVQIVDGTGDTAGPPNGRGNLIVGYNEDVLGDTAPRTGSHNIVVGMENGYSSYGGLVAGFSNTVSGAMASVTGGNENQASGPYASVNAGYRNEARGEAAGVSGGDFNFADGIDSSISGGNYNDALDTAASVSGGTHNQATGPYASVSGGGTNLADGEKASVTGGYYNTASGEYSAVSGGDYNLADGFRGSVTGGSYNTASGDYSAVSGGYARDVFGAYDWQGGGLFETD